MTKILVGKTQLITENIKIFKATYQDRKTF